MSAQRPSSASPPRYRGFPPFIRPDSRILVLGSFPSIQSRARGFYYGNPRNRFWPTLASFAGLPAPATIPEKQALLARLRIALWDMAAECEIEGSMDSDLRNVRTVDLAPLMARARIERILLNGRKAESLFLSRCPSLGHLALYLPSTSPANPAFSPLPWHAALTLP
jgi:hypoxanthine-DNA glycosylase